MIFITGMMRSRTSLVCAMLEKCGVDFGAKENLEGPSSSNPLGFYENKKFKKKIQRLYWEKIGFEITDRTKVPVSSDIALFEGSRLNFDSNMEKFYGTSYPNIAIKDPKLCLYWEYWYDLFPDAKWVIVTRCKDDNLYSLYNRTPWTKGTHNKIVWNKYRSMVSKRIEELQEEIPQWFIIDSDSLVQKDFWFFKTCVTWLGYQHSPEAEKLIDPNCTYLKK